MDERQGIISSVRLDGPLDEGTCTERVSRTDNLEEDQCLPRASINAGRGGQQRTSQTRDIISLAQADFVGGSEGWSSPEDFQGCVDERRSRQLLTEGPWPADASAVECSSGLHNRWSRDSQQIVSSNRYRA